MVVQCHDRTINQNCWSWWDYFQTFEPLLINWQMTWWLFIIFGPIVLRRKIISNLCFLFWFSLVCFYGSGLWLFLVPDCLVAIKQSNFMSNALKTFELQVLHVTSILGDKHETKILEKWFLVLFEQFCFTCKWMFNSNTWLGLSQRVNTTCLKEVTT